VSHYQKNEKENLLFLIPSEIAFELVEQVVGCLTDDFSVETSEMSVVLPHLGRLNQALPALKICLSTKTKSKN